MITSKVNFLPKSTAELEIAIPWSEIKTTYQTIFDKVAQSMEISGFRKGKAPKELIEKNINKSKIYEEVVKDVIPKAYQDAVKTHNLIPIISPKIEVIKAKENEDWVVKATVALKPNVKLGNYKEKVKSLKKPKTEIWTPGSTKDKREKDKKPSLDELINVVSESVDVELSDLLISQETNRLLADLVDQVRKLGLTVEQYLMAKGKTTEQIKLEYAKQAEKTLKIEFALAEIADSEKITVTQDDIDKLIAKVEKPEEREKLKKDSYYLAHLIRQQKTIDFLNNL